MSRHLHDGRDDGLEPLESLDVCGAAGLADLLENMSRTAFGGRSLGEAYQVLRTMVDDPECTVVVTVSGAMTVAKMGRLLCEMIDRGMAQMVVSTGAIMAHGLSEAIGGVHYKVNPEIPDRQLYEWGYNRVYDTLEMEANLAATERTVSAVLEGLEPHQRACSRQITQAIGKRLVDEGQMPSVLGSAFQQEVPVYIPSFTDSELGLDVATSCLVRDKAPTEGADYEEFFSDVPAMNPFLDLNDYARRILGARRLGIFTIGGGVPRNWAQQVGPYIDVINMRLGTDLPVPRFYYGVRICPEPVHWGGLSGCTYSEGVSWGKFVSREEGGRFAEVHCDATIAWPILVRALVESRCDETTEEGEA